MRPPPRCTLSLTPWPQGLTLPGSPTQLGPSLIPFFLTLCTRTKFFVTSSLLPLTGTYRPLYLRQCQPPISCRPCTHSQPSCSAWHWNSNSGCTLITHCTACRCLPRRTTTVT